MSKLIVWMLVAAGLYYGYTHYYNVKPSQAAMVYMSFSEALARGKYEEAASMAAGRAADAVDQKRSEMTRNIGPSGKVYGQSLPSVSAATLTNEIAGPISKVSFNTTEETRVGDKVALKGRQSVCREQPGCTGARCFHCAESIHTAELCADSAGGAMKVCVYSITDVDTPH